MIQKYSKSFLLALCLIATAVFWHYKGQHTPMIAGTEIHAEALPDFVLLTTDQGALTPASFEGRWSFLFFGYTHCPDICPAMMALLDNVEGQLTADEAQFVFISADPKNDDLEQLDTYVHSFNPRFIGATGAPEDVNALMKKLHLFFSPQNADGTIDHSNVLLLINPKAELVAVFTAPKDPRTVVADFRSLTKRAH